MADGGADHVDHTVAKAGSKVSAQDGNGGENKGATEGRIKAIYYDSSDPFTPVKVVLNTDYQDNGGEGDEFQISRSELQYLFSVYGEFEVDDKVAIVWEKSGSDENATYTVVDVVGDY